MITLMPSFLDLLGKIVIFITTLTSSFLSLNQENYQRPRPLTPSEIVRSAISSEPEKKTTLTSATTTATTTPPKKVVEKKSIEPVEKKEVIVLPKPSTPVITITEPEKEPAQIIPPEQPIISLPLGNFNEKVRAATVNILCTTKSGGSLKPITASGVLIDPRGVILTNAHVAQYFLLKDYFVKDFVECIARIGSPAKPAYKLDLLYISPSWIEENRKSITSEHPLGTGEDDFALLTIPGPVGDNTLPSQFPYLEPDISEFNDTRRDINYIMAGYPAGFLSGAIIQRDFYQSSTVSTVKNVFTFGTNTIDVISLGGSVVAQRGSSGGPIASSETGKLSGIIVTTTDAVTTAERDARAITLSHINRSLIKTNDTSLSSYLLGDLQIKRAEFYQSKFSFLSSLLIAELSGNN